MNSSKICQTTKTAFVYFCSREVKKFRKGSQIILVTAIDQIFPAEGSICKKDIFTSFDEEIIKENRLVIQKGTSKASGAHVAMHGIITNRSMMTSGVLDTNVCHATVMRC